MFPTAFLPQWVWQTHNTRTHVHTHVHTYTHARTHAHARTHTHTPTHTHPHTHPTKQTQNEMTWVLERQGAGGGDVGSDGVLRCRGLPFGTAEGQVKEFFEGYDIAEDGITIPTDSMGR